ncbi:hypothetical protein [Shumkonia mesophila]|nr:hypothetical protein [Shumkonia mesophila]
MLRRIIVSLFLLSFAASVAGCGDTWRGMRQDTSENLDKASDAVK